MSDQPATATAGAGSELIAAALTAVQSPNSLPAALAAVPTNDQPAVHKSQTSRKRCRPTEVRVTSAIVGHLSFFAILQMTITSVGQKSISMKTS